MEVSMLTEGQATRTVARLVRECSRFDVAVAWAGANRVVDAMLAAHPKLGKVIIGKRLGILCHLPGQRPGVSVRSCRKPTRSRHRGRRIGRRSVRGAARCTGTFPTAHD